MVRSPGVLATSAREASAARRAEILHRREGRGNGGATRSRQGADRQVRSDATAAPDAQRQADQHQAAEVCCAAHQRKKRHITDSRS